METSKKFTINKQDLKKIGKGLLVAVIGAGLTYGTEQLPMVDFGVYTPIVTAGFAVLANVIRKRIAGHA